MFKQLRIRCTGIKDIHSVNNMIMSLKDLKNLDINFASLLEVNDDRLKLLKGGIEALQTLTSLHLNFQRLISMAI